MPTSQRAFGPMPALEGVDADVPRTEYSYDLIATDRFKSTWLPTTQHISAIQAEGDWRFDLATRDFLAAPEDLTTESATWNFQGVELTLDAESLSQTSVAAGLVNSELTSLPAGLSSEVRDLAVSVTQRAPSRFEKAVALQSWFRGGGGFVYDISRPRGNSADDLVAFLRDAPGGRTGYCEQFAASMAVMARILGIPARVAIGFLRPEGVGPQTWVYSAHDLHAWPELYFEGAGWVRFEPTPSARVSRVPRYTTQNLTPAIEPTPSASATGPAREDPIREPRVPEPEPTAAQYVAEESGGPGAGMLAAAALAGILIALAAMTPRAIRRRRRERRCAGGVEEVWAEIADTVRDLNLDWPRDRSPRETAATLAGWFGSPPDEFTPERPLRGPAVNPEAVVALERIVTALEVLRYAERDAGRAGGWSDDAQACILALIGGTPRNTRRRAEWLPHSLWGRTKATATTEEPTGGDPPTRPDLVDRVS